MSEISWKRERIGETTREDTHLPPLSLLKLPSPSDETLVACFTKCLAVCGTTSSLLCTLNRVTCFFLNPRRFFVPVKERIKC